METAGPGLQQGWSWSTSHRRRSVPSRQPDAIQQSGNTSVAWTEGAPSSGVLSRTIQRQRGGMLATGSLRRRHVDERPVELLINSVTDRRFGSEPRKLLSVGDLGVKPNNRGIGQRSRAAC